MGGPVRILMAGLKLLMLTLLGAFVVTLRYLWKTPQPLRSSVPGDPRIYRWTGGAIFYTVAGENDAPPIVLLHEPAIGASSYEMRHLIEGLAQRYRVYVPDLPGFGLSDRPALSYTAETYVQLCQDFVANVVAQPALLLGSGLSGNYSIAVAASRPDLCNGVILLSPQDLFTKQELPHWLVQLMLHPLIALPFYSICTTPPVLRQILAKHYTINSAQITPEELAPIFASAHQFGAEHAALAWLAGNLDLDIHAQFARLTQPTLTIWDSHTLNSMPASIREGRPAPLEKTAIIEGAGQHIHEEQPAQVVTSILAWQKAQEPVAVATAPIRSDQNGQFDKQASRETTIVVPQPEQVPEAETPPEPVLPKEDQREQPASETTVGETQEKEQNVVEAETIDAYCVRCRQKRVMQDPHKIVTKNGRSALEGTCPVCNTRLFRFIKG